MDIILEQLLPLAVTLLAALLTALVGYATAWLRAKARREETRYQEGQARVLLDHASDVITDAVAEVDQTKVEGWKAADGGLTRDQQEEALAAAKATVARNLGPARMRLLTAVLGGSADSWITTKIEATVGARRRSRPRSLSAST